MTNALFVNAEIIATIFANNSFYSEQFAILRSYSEIKFSYAYVLRRESELQLHVRVHQSTYLEKNYIIDETNIVLI